jgi:hypothetical protein
MSWIDYWCNAQTVGERLGALVDDLHVPGTGSGNRALAVARPIRDPSRPYPIGPAS